jgi:alkylation response protein AidB-like acyl-CoA dehydrogenase
MSAPLTDVGHQLLQLAQSHAATARSDADERDRAGRFPVEAIESMKASGFLKATIPVELGGLGITQLRDLVPAMSALAHGDPSLAIAVNMHLTAGIVSSRMASLADDAGGDALRAFLELLAGGALVCTPNSEPGTDLRHPLTEARRVDGGWAVTGRKGFATLSPVADVFIVSCRIRDDDADDTSGLAVIFAGTPGVEIDPTWDALGMRASGSHDVVLSDCFVPDGLLIEGGPWGVWTDGGVITSMVANAGLLGVFLGIAQSARDLAVGRAVAAGSDRVEHPGLQHQVAEMHVALLTCQSTVEAAYIAIDSVLSMREPPSDVVHAASARFQCAKIVVQRTAAEVVDRAMTVSGGRSFLTRDPLSRLYRDVHAVGFMQPFSPIEAYRYIGAVALGTSVDGL